jgi:hypothetical protein
MHTPSQIFTYTYHVGERVLLALDYVFLNEAGQHALFKLHAVAVVLPEHLENLAAVLLLDACSQFETHNTYKYIYTLGHHMHAQSHTHVHSWYTPFQHLHVHEPQV